MEEIKPITKPVIWIGSSLDDLRELPEEVQDDIGFILDRVQRGIRHKDVKPLAGLSGVQEIRTDYDKDTYRAVYALKLANAVYMLHVFKKKSKKGSETPKQDMEMIRTRF